MKQELHTSSENREGSGHGLDSDSLRVSCWGKWHVLYLNTERVGWGKKETIRDPSLPTLRYHTLFPLDSMNHTSTRLQRMISLLPNLPTHSYLFVRGEKNIIRNSWTRSPIDSLDKAYKTYKALSTLALPGGTKNHLTKPQFLWCCKWPKVGD